jgi:hypothetical protein
MELPVTRPPSRLEMAVMWAVTTLTVLSAAVWTWRVMQGVLGQ